MPRRNKPLITRDEMIKTALLGFIWALGATIAYFLIANIPLLVATLAPLAIGVTVLGVVTAAGMVGYSWYHQQALADTVSQFSYSMRTSLQNLPSNCREFMLDARHNIEQFAANIALFFAEVRDRATAKKEQISSSATTAATELQSNVAKFSNSVNETITYYWPTWLQRQVTVNAQNLVTDNNDAEEDLETDIQLRTQFSSSINKV